MQWIMGLQVKENISSNQGNNQENIGLKWSIAVLQLSAPHRPTFKPVPGLIKHTPAGQTHYNFKCAFA